MLRVTEEVVNLSNGNKIIVFGKKGNDSIDITIPNILFQGKNNVLALEIGVKFSNTRINFLGSDSLAVIGKQFGAAIMINWTLLNRCTIILGKGSYTSGVLNIIASEAKSVLIGNNCLFSFGIWIRTSDVHLIMDLDNVNRINFARNINIGSNVWIGQNVSILKGTMIGSGSVIGLGSIVSGRIDSNVVAAGNPAKILKDNIFWDRASAHAYVNDEDYLININNLKKEGPNLNFSKLEDNSDSFISFVNGLKELDALSRFKLVDSKSTITENLVIKSNSNI